MTKVPVGFEFATVAVQKFDSSTAFATALRKQRENYSLVPASGVSGFAVDGRLEGQSEDLRVTREAASQLCSIVGVPPAFLFSLAKRNEPLAQDVIRDAVSAYDCTGLHMLVDSAAARVDGFTLKPQESVPSDRIVAMAQSAAPNGHMTGAWIAGPLSRVAIVGEAGTDVRRKSSKVGDIMRAGFELTNLLSPTGGVSTVTDYVYRLRCANGMLSVDASGIVRIPHYDAGDGAEHRIGAAVLAANARSIEMLDLSRKAAATFLDLPALKKVQSFLLNPAHGGGVNLLKQATQTARREATNDGRSPGEVSVWDFVNGVTDAAKQAKSLERRRAIESLGHRLLLSSMDQ